MVDEAVAQDPEQPGPQVRPLREAGRADKSARIRILHEVLGIAGIAAQVTCQPVQLVDVVERAFGQGRRCSRFLSDHGELGATPEQCHCDDYNERPGAWFPE
jgi:hypothetical protein